MPPISVIICSHNPTRKYIERTLASLKAQTLDRSEWDLLLVDNNSSEPLSDACDLSWHPAGRHVREERPGLTSARIRGIAESTGELLAFFDDDNVLAPDYLVRSKALWQAQPLLGVFGSGALEPEFEEVPSPLLVPRLSMLALRTVRKPQCAHRRTDIHCMPWGAGLCVRRAIASRYANWIKQLNVTSLGRSGERLFCGEDDVFSLMACEQGLSFGIFPELRITHLIPPRRLTEDYIIRLIHDHAFSHTILKHLLFGESESRVRPLETVRTFVHGLRRGRFSLKCRMAEARGTEAAIRLIDEQQLRPIDPSTLRNKEACAQT